MSTWQAEESRIVRADAVNEEMQEALCDYALPHAQRKERCAEILSDIPLPILKLVADLNYADTEGKSRAKLIRNILAAI